MADDIDDLLDKVENKYISGHKSKSSSGQNDSWDSSDDEANARIKPILGTTNTHELSDLLDELVVPQECESKQLQRGKSLKEHSPTKTDSKLLHRGASLKGPSAKKCFPVFIGGTNCDSGLCTSVHQRCCNELRCTDCDFHIEAFENNQWDPSTDYLFLRNNMPDRVKLKAKLLNKKGVRAYSCQCKWRSVSQLKNIQNEADLKWVCGRH